MSTGTHRSACHVCFVAKPELSDPGRESVAKPTREQGLSFTATTGVTSGSSQETSGGNGSEPCACTPDPHCPRARRGRLGREKCALQTAVWGVGSGVMLGAACGLPPPSSPGGPPVLSTARPPTGLWAPAPTLAHFHGPLPAAALHGRSAVSSGPHQATGRAALAPRASSRPSGAGGPLPLSVLPHYCAAPWR